jgi:hypothetical protein
MIDLGLYSKKSTLMYVMGLDEIEAEEELAKIDDEIIDAYAMDG